MEGPNLESLQGLAGMLPTAVGEDFEEKAAQIRRDLTEICTVCGTPHMKKGQPTCAGCNGLLNDGLTALVGTNLQYVFLEFPENSENAEFRGTVQPVDNRVIATAVAKAQSNESSEQS